MKRLVFCALACALAIGLSAGPAMAVQVYTGTTAAPGTVLFYDDFEGPAPLGAPDNGVYPGTWVPGGNGTIQNSNPYDGNQNLQRGPLTTLPPAQDPSDPRVKVGNLESEVTSGTIHAEVMFKWLEGHGTLGDGFAIGTVGVTAEADALMSFFPMADQIFWMDSDLASVAGSYGYLFSGLIDFDAGGYHKLEIDHTIGTADYTLTVTDMTDPSNPIPFGSETATAGTAPSESVGTVMFHQTNNPMNAAWDNAGPMVPEPGTWAILATGLLSLAWLRRRKKR